MPAKRRSLTDVTAESATETHAMRLRAVDTLPRAVGKVISGSEFTVGGEKSYVYLGICNGRPTKWVTAAPWDFKIECQLNPASGDLSYKDGQGRPMQVLEKGDPGWGEW